MTLLSLQRVERCYGDLIVFSDATLRVDERDRIGIIGDNGTGKTTLVRVICGEDAPDAGQRVARRRLDIAWTTQIPVIDDDLTVVGAARQAFSRVEAMERELRELEERMATTPDAVALQREHERIQHAFEHAGGYRREHYVDQALTGLGFERPTFDKRVSVLSGGEKARLALARTMLLPADLLVLDEPTNHLDLEGIAFLEQWLAGRDRAYIVVSHDRRFLDRVCTSIVEVDGGHVKRYRGNYSDYRTQKEREIKTALRELDKQNEFVAKEMAYIRKHMGGRWTAQAKGRLKRLSRLQRLQAPRRPRAAMKLRLGRDARGLEGQCVIEGQALGLRWDNGRELFSSIDFRIFHGDRIGLLGRNGTGKSTLLRIVAGELAPTSGQVDRARMLRVAYFSQEMEDLPESGTVLETFMARVPQWTEGECRDHLALFMFQADDVDADLASLSGGEKRRLCLARLVVAPADIYLMDEPTNHLDITTREALEDALAAFPGTVFLVSHDRWFLRRVARRIFELQPDRIVVHEHGIEGYEESMTERRRAADAAKKAERAAKKERAVPAPTSKVSGPAGERIRNPWAFEKLEARIVSLEEELEEIHARAGRDDLWKSPGEMRKIQQREGELRQELAQLYEQWENWQ